MNHAAVVSLHWGHWHQQHLWNGTFNQINKCQVFLFLKSKSHLVFADWAISTHTFCSHMHNLNPAWCQSSASQGDIKVTPPTVHIKDGLPLLVDFYCNKLQGSILMQGSSYLRFISITGNFFQQTWKTKRHIKNFKVKYNIEIPDMLVPVSWQI